MPEPRKLIIIAKQREFDEEQWKHLLIAMAYYLHDQRKRQTSGDVANQADTKGQ